jgi:hypothetical protein
VTRGVASRPLKEAGASCNIQRHFLYNFATVTWSGRISLSERRLALQIIYSTGDAWLACSPSTVTRFAISRNP